LTNPWAAGAVAVYGNSTDDALVLWVQYEQPLGAAQLGAVLVALRDLQVALTAPELPTDETAWESDEWAYYLPVVEASTGRSLTLIFGGAAAAVSWLISRWRTAEQARTERASQKLLHAETDQKNASTEHESAVADAMVEKLRAEQEAAEAQTRYWDAMARRLHEDLDAERRTRADVSTAILSRELQRSNVVRLELNGVQVNPQEEAAA
jgi:septal ring factor EnvC (AmiA/AmiB activator)